MWQIKIFSRGTMNQEHLERRVNEWLKEMAPSIKKVRIKVDKLVSLITVLYKLRKPVSSTTMREGIKPLTQR